MKIALYTAGAFVAGVFAGRWLMENTLSAEAAGEIAEAKSFYKDKYEKATREHIEKINAGNKDTVKLLKNAVSEVEEVRETAAKETVNSLIQAGAYTSYNNLKPAQPTGETTSTEGIRGPFIISQEEFFDRGLDKQNQITYYAGNDTLVNAKGNVVPAEDRAVLIGMDTLSKFGELSEDDTVVYVRNTALGAGVDFEITLDEGNYGA